MFKSPSEACNVLEHVSISLVTLISCMSDWSHTSNMMVNNSNIYSYIFESLPCPILIMLLYFLIFFSYISLSITLTQVLKQNRCLGATVSWLPSNHRVMKHEMMNLCGQRKGLWEVWWPQMKNASVSRLSLDKSCHSWWWLVLWDWRLPLPCGSSILSNEWAIFCKPSCRGKIYWVS